MEAMTIHAINAFIEGVGFPVAVCVFLFWTNHKNAQTNQQILKEFKEILSENTTTLKLLHQRIEHNERK